MFTNNLKAIIDLGSLKAKLAVFDIKKVELVLLKSYLTLLGKTITEQGLIIEEALNRLETAVSSARDELRALGCVDVSFVATESLRLAKNKEDVYAIVNKFFPAHPITILDQEIEGEMFFKAVSACFSDQIITAMDVGGGSVQLLHGGYNRNEGKHFIHKKYLYKTGTYKLQQKYSPDNAVISLEFGKAVDELKEKYQSLDLSNDILVFGSTCMLDFLKESGIKLYNDQPMAQHPFYTTVSHLKDLLVEIRKYPPDSRSHFYPSGDYFIYGADYLLINVIEAAEKLGAKYIYPTNINSAYGFI